MYHLGMLPDFYQSQEQIANVGFLKSIIGLLIVLFASFVGVEIRLGNEDDEP